MINYSFKTGKATCVLANIKTILLRSNASGLVKKSKCFVFDRKTIEKDSDYKMVACKPCDFPDMKCLELHHDSCGGRIRGTFYIDGVKHTIIFITDEVVSIG